MASRKKKGSGKVKMESENVLISATSDQVMQTRLDSKMLSVFIIN